MRRRTYKWFCASLLLVVIATVVYADTPFISGQVVADGGVTRYLYTLTNVLPSGQIVSLYDMILPDGNLPIDHSESAGWVFWFLKAGNTPWGKFSWVAGSAQSILQQGQSAVFEVYTSQPVVTHWTSTWHISVRPVEGRDYAYSDGTELPVPVPVPEPASILSLGIAVSGLGAVIIRRRCL